jgi:hypothetical protein
VSQFSSMDVIRPRHRQPNLTKHLHTCTGTSRGPTRLDVRNQGIVGLGSTDQNLFTGVASLCQRGGYRQSQNQHQGQQKKVRRLSLLAPNSCLFIANSPLRIQTRKAGRISARLRCRYQEHRSTLRPRLPCSAVANTIRGVRLSFTKTVGGHRRGNSAQPRMGRLRTPVTLNSRSARARRRIR